MKDEKIQQDKQRMSRWIRFWNGQCLPPNIVDDLRDRDDLPDIIDAIGDIKCTACGCQIVNPLLK